MCCSRARFKPGRREGHLEPRTSNLDALRLLLQPAHHGAQLGAYLLDRVLRVDSTQGQEAGPARLVLQDPLAGEGAVLDLAQDPAHALPDVLVDDARGAGRVAVLRGG